MARHKYWPNWPHAATRMLKGVNPILGVCFDLVFGGR